MATPQTTTTDAELMADVVIELDETHNDHNGGHDEDCVVCVGYASDMERFGSTATMLPGMKAEVYGRWLHEAGSYLVGGIS